MKKISILAVSLLLFLSGFTSTNVVHADTVLPFNTTVSGSISEQAPMDAYTVIVPKAGTLTITVKAYFSAALMELRDSNNELVGHYEGVYNGRPENPTTLNKEINVEPGVYTLFIKDANKTSFGNYDVSVSFEPANNIEIEPNQTFTEAMPINVNGERIRGFISWNDTADFYKVELDEPGRLEIDIDSKMMNGIVYLYDSKGEMISWDSLGFYQELPLLWNSHTDLETDTYYISIKGNDYYQGIYEMDVSFIPANNDEIEPNNSRESATPIEVNDNKIHTGFLSYTDKEDYYRIEMKYDGYMTIGFSSEFSGYSLMKERSISYDSHLSSGAIGKPEKSSKRVELKKGTYYFIPYAQVIWQGGVYTMSFKAEPAFKDMAGRYTPAVTYLADKEVAKGISGSEFGVQDNIKRVDAAIWLANIMKLNQSDSRPTPYVDVPERAWGAVNALKRKNIVNGKSSTHFGANDTMTRGEMALLIQRAYELSGNGVKLPFTDVSSRYAEAVKALMKHNITQGKSADKFGTDAAITRGEMALFLYRADSK
ncbi:S-layer homology domain-containing protein [Sporosarcina thermotolerans]|uniref:S-layer homology domain-containing protein n=1 Tax=Sporosarcina thermotolerans TaxID=633404 RepID=A0AAW9AF63_9BACL|nr:S-layer homology domain-containing protein [Sporosarcina thermotolerans]MDW0118789.1 S-layer homology domain-containing protein [Sporosarcina thermotolerans]WHT48476.1 S-layer homology domain-containing protein [Sporosarcina thermotolerans]